LLRGQIEEMKNTDNSINSKNIPLVSIITACRNEVRYIEEFLNSALAQTLPTAEIEVLIADGSSNDGTREVIEKITAKHSSLKLIDNPYGIVSTGLNAAIKQARGKIIIRMDAHTEYAPDYVRQCVSVLEETRADNVGGPWVARGAGRISRAIAAAFQSHFAVGRARGHRPDYEGFVDTVYLGCWYKDIFKKIGLFDEELVRNQDDEMNLRIIRAGGNIWQSPRIKSWYRPRGSLVKLWRQYFQYGFWKVRVIQKHTIPASVRHLIPAMFALALILGLVACLIHPVFRTGYIGMLFLYTSFIAFGSLITAMKSGWNLLPILPVVFSIFHLSYGLGFLAGIWHFAVMGRRGHQAGKWAVQLTR